LKHLNIVSVKLDIRDIYYADGAPKKTAEFDFQILHDGIIYPLFFSVRLVNNNWEYLYAKHRKPMIENLSCPLCDDVMAWITCEFILSHKDEFFNLLTSHPDVRLEWMFN
jgi:hypothetical protein